MGTSIGGAIDFLYSGTNPNTTTTLLTDLKAYDKDVVLADNEPSVAAASMVIIGRQNYESAQTAQNQNIHVVLGAGRIEEDYMLHGYVQTLRSGPDQKPARDAALAIYDIVVHWISADLTLGGLLKQGRSVTDFNANLIQTETEADTAGGDMRFAEVDFSFRIQNHYIP